jgi:hypothetical protein
MRTESRLRAPRGLLDCDRDCMGLFRGFGVHGVIPRIFGNAAADSLSAVIVRPRSSRGQAPADDPVVPALGRGTAPRAAKLRSTGSPARAGDDSREARDCMGLFRGFGLHGVIPRNSRLLGAAMATQLSEEQPTCARQPEV